jgi:hypothetical protein
MSTAVKARKSSRVPTITEKEFDALSWEDRTPYFRLDEFSPELNASLDEIHAACGGVLDVHHLGGVPRKEDGTVRRPTDDEFYEMGLAPRGLMWTKFDCRGDVYKTAAKAIRRMAAKLMKAAERVEALAEGGAA